MKIGGLKKGDVEMQVVYLDSFFQEFGYREWGDSQKRCGIKEWVFVYLLWVILEYV